MKTTIAICILILTVIALNLPHRPSVTVMLAQDPGANNAEPTTTMTRLTGTSLPTLDPKFTTAVMTRITIKTVHLANWLTLVNAAIDENGTAVTIGDAPEPRHAILTTEHEPMVTKTAAGWQIKFRD